jgi:hypothetical protein
MGVVALTATRSHCHPLARIVTANCAQNIERHTVMAICAMRDAFWDSNHWKVTASSIEETSAALQVGMPPTQNIEHMSLAMHYAEISYKL